MKTETREVYKCDHCNKLYQIKSYCLKHELTCDKNPKNQRKCFSCEHLTTEKMMYYEDTGYGETKRELNVFYCGKIDSALYPPKVEHKGNWYDFGDTLNQPMKKECSDFSDQKQALESFDDWLKGKD